MLSYIPVTCKLIANVVLFLTVTMPFLPDGNQLESPLSSNFFHSKAYFVTSQYDSFKESGGHVMKTDSNTCIYYAFLHRERHPSEQRILFMKSSPSEFHWTHQLDSMIACTKCKY